MADFYGDEPAVYGNKHDIDDVGNLLEHILKELREITKLLRDKHKSPEPTAPSAAPSAAPKQP